MIQIIKIKDVNISQKDVKLMLNYCAETFNVALRISLSSLKIIFAKQKKLAKINKNIKTCKMIRLRFKKSLFFRTL